ncbi:MAG: zinc finger domain-containing protein, partial [Candidatus Krumholzibacteria bacterium]
KSLLLDQRILSGIGNIYADELLFYLEIDPRTPGHRVAPKSARLLSKARTVLKRAIAHGGTTLRDYRKVDGTEGAFQKFHAVYGRSGEECVECGGEIKRIVLAGRGTHFCPHCQR